MKELLVFFAAMSFLAFLFYGIDKWKARHDRFRIRESVLLSLSFFGGAVGGFLAMCLFRHKTRHWYFLVVNFLGIAWQVLALVYIYQQYGMTFFS